MAGPLEQLSGTPKWSKIWLSVTSKRSKIWLLGTPKESKIGLSETPKWSKISILSTYGPNIENRDTPLVSCLVLVFPKKSSIRRRIKF